MSESAASRKLSRRLSGIQPTERQRLLTLAQGVPDLIHLALGDPDLDTPAPIVEAGVRALRNGCTHYTPWAGLPDLRRAISEKLERENNLSYNPESEIVVTTGVQQAMFVTIQALMDPGDEILMGDPGYNYYEHITSLSNGRLIWVPTYRDSFVLEPETLRRYITPRTKALVVVNPNNPTGTVIPRETLHDLAQVVQQHDLLVISDEIYEKLVYDEVKPVSIASLPGMHDRSIVLNGFSKAYAMTGWRIGYMAAPADFVERIQVLKHTMCLSVNHAVQVAAIEALNCGDECLKKMVGTYERRRKFVLKALDDMGLGYAYPHGGFSVFVDISSTGKSSFAFCEDLLLRKHVLVFPGTLYGEGEGYVRLTLNAPIETLEVAMKKMAELVCCYD